MAVQEEPGLSMMNGLGDVVRDTIRNQIVRVTGVDGNLKQLTVTRPSGLAWQVDDHHCRPASNKELRDWNTAVRTVSEVQQSDLPSMPRWGCEECGSWNLKTQRLRARKEDTAEAEAGLRAHMEAVHPHRVEVEASSEGE